jgi:hypothetical protein
LVSIRAGKRSLQRLISESFLSPDVTFSPNFIWNSCTQLHPDHTLGVVLLLKISYYTKNAMVKNSNIQVIFN